jgi:anti-anti-sigma factor
VPSSDAIDGETRPADRHPMVGALRCGIDPALPGRLCLIGEADLNGEDTLRTALDTVSGHGVDVIVDLRALTFLSAGAARVLAQAAVRLPRPRRLLLLDPTWSVARILTLCGIDRLAGVAVLAGEGPEEQPGHADG